jgi:hypothetical protein
MRRTEVRPISKWAIAALLTLVRGSFRICAASDLLQQDPADIPGRADKSCSVDENRLRPLAPPKRIERATLVLKPLVPDGRSRATVPNVLKTRSALQ